MESWQKTKFRYIVQYQVRNSVLLFLILKATSLEVVVEATAVTLCEILPVQPIVKLYPASSAEGFLFPLVNLILRVDRYRNKL